MKKTRRKFTSEFKLKVIMEALKERSTLRELSQRFDLHPNQISQWKKEFLTKAKNVMDSKVNTFSSLEKEQDKLYLKIGQLQMEVDFLKKKLC